jgi:hypothetical protein
VKEGRLKTLCTVEKAKLQGQCRGLLGGGKHIISRGNVLDDGLFLVFISVGIISLSTFVKTWRV